MEQRRMHPRQVPHQTAHGYGHPPLDNLQPPFYPGFPEPLGGGPKATQLPRPLPPPMPPPYVQQHYVLDRGLSVEAQGSPPQSYRTSDRAHTSGHSSHRHPASPPQLQQPQPRQAAVYALFPQGPEAYHTTHVFSTQMSRAPQHMPLDSWAVAAFSDNANAHLTEMEGGPPHVLDEPMYPSNQQPLSPLSTMRPSTYAQVIPPKRSPTTPQNTNTSPTSFHGDAEGSSNAENSPQMRSWGGAGSLDPTTGVFSRAADHPRIRTAQACEKCRARKAKCSGEHPSCQRCLTRGLVCAYAAERRMRGPNKPKSHTPLPDGSQHATAVGQKTRKRASTMPSATHQNWGHLKNGQQERGIAPPMSPASESSVGSLAYPPMAASESDASPMTPPHSSLDSRQLPVPVVDFSAPQRVLVQDFPTTVHRRGQACVSDGTGHDDAGAAATRRVLAGVFGQDLFMM